MQHAAGVPGQNHDRTADLLTYLARVRIAPIAAQSTCNGHAEFCDRLYSNVSVIGAHNSYGVSKGNSE